MILIRGGIGLTQAPMATLTHMYVCICNGVTENDIRHAAAAGCRSVPELTMRTGCGSTCGTCLDSAAQVLHEVQQAAVRIELPLLSNAA